MNENVKSIFFVSVLVLLLLGISAVTAADNDTVTSNDIVSDTPEVASSDAIVTENVQTDSENTVETNAKNMKKENKNIKTSTQTVTVNNFNELQTAWTDMENTEAEEFIINLNEGDYRFNNDLKSYRYKSMNIILNGNNQIFTSNEGWEGLCFPNTANVTINNLTQNISFNTHGNTYLNNIIINGAITNNGENISFNNCMLNNMISNSGILTIADNCLFGENLVFSNYNGGEIKSNDSDKLSAYYYRYEGNYTLENINIPNERLNYGNLTLINSNINGRLDNNGNLTIKNSTLNSRLVNYGNLTISDDVILGLNFSIYNYGEITMNDSDKLLPFMGQYSNGNYIIENVNIITPRTNRANVTFRNCTLNSEIYNEGNLTINDDCIFGENLNINNQKIGNIIINDTDSLIPYYRTYDNGNYTIENVVIGGQKTIRRNSTVTIINATINSNISNMGNVIIINSTINSTIQNNQNLTMQGICIFGENYYLNNYGNFINETKEETTLKVYVTTLIIGQTVKIQSNIYYGNEIQSNITKGKITFKVNGKTLKDANGKTIYAKVVNGTAVIENYIVPKDWSKDGTTIQAVYSGSSQLEKLTSEKTEINIEKIMPTLSTYEIQATAGSTITLTATLNDNTINTGKIVFKINGKTVKDANGKVIYSKVVNGSVSVEYSLPANMKSKEYNITAVFTSSEYDRLKDTKILTVN